MRLGGAQVEEADGKKGDQPMDFVIKSDSSRKYTHVLRESEVRSESLFPTNIGVAVTSISTVAVTEPDTNMKSRPVTQRKILFLPAVTRDYYRRYSFERNKTWRDILGDGSRYPISIFSWLFRTKAVTAKPFIISTP